MDPATLRRRTDLQSILIRASQRLSYTTRPNTVRKAESEPSNTDCAESPVCTSPGVDDVWLDAAKVIPCGVPTGAGPGESVVGMSPAVAEKQSIPVKAVAITRRFMIVLLHI